jgi:hypothetical protein
MSSPFTAGDDRRYVDLKTLRRMFGFSRSGVYRLIDAGKLTRRKLGGRNRFSVEEAESLMRSLPTGGVDERR